MPLTASRLPCPDDSVGFLERLDGPEDPREYPVLVRAHQHQLAAREPRPRLPWCWVRPYALFAADRAHASPSFAERPPRGSSTCAAVVMACLNPAPAPDAPIVPGFPSPLCSPPRTGSSPSFWRAHPTSLRSQGRSRFQSVFCRAQRASAAPTVLEVVLRACRDQSPRHNSITFWIYCQWNYPLLHYFN